jgi:hypothetical protein
MSYIENFCKSADDFTELLRKLVRKDLGCDCSGEIFDQIRILKGEATPGKTYLGIIVGERLLIGFVRADDIRPMEENAGRLILSGATYRDSLMLNRFRLIVEGDVSEDEKALLESEAGKYERVTVHYFETM